MVTTRSPRGHLLVNHAYRTTHLRSDRRATVHPWSTDLIPGAVFGPGARDHQFAYGVASLAPSGDGIKDDFYGNRSHLSELQIASRLSFNSIRLGLEEIFCFLQLPDQLFDFRNRWGSSLPNKWRDIRISLGLRRRRRLYVNEIVVFAFGFHNTHSFNSWHGWRRDSVDRRPFAIT